MPEVRLGRLGRVSSLYAKLREQTAYIESIPPPEREVLPDVTVGLDFNTLFIKMILEKQQTYTHTDFYPLGGLWEKGEGEKWNGASRGRTHTELQMDWNTDRVRQRPWKYTHTQTYSNVSKSIFESIRQPATLSLQLWHKDKCADLQSGVFWINGGITHAHWGQGTEGSEVSLTSLEGGLC